MRFTKLAGRRYTMTVVRERGPLLAPRQGPGYHDYLPHDAVHFLVEAEARLSGGIFGRIAAGDSNIFATADPALERKQRRREAKRTLGREEHADMARSEQLASRCPPLWEVRAGHLAALPEWLSEREATPAESELVDRILARLDIFASTWHALPVGASVGLEWPRALQK